MGLVNDATNNQLTYRIIGAAMNAHNQLGPGYKEEIYEKALKIELDNLGISAIRQVPVEVYYDFEDGLYRINPDNSTRKQYNQPVT